MDDTKSKWYILEGMQATTKINQSPEDSQLAATTLNDNWYHLEREGATRPTHRSSVSPADFSNVNTSNSSLTVTGSINTTHVFNANSSSFKEKDMVSQSDISKNKSQGNRGVITVSERKENFNPSSRGFRLNLQESIDGEISESHHSSSINSTPSVLSSDLPSINGANNTSSLLQQAHDINWSSFNSNKHSESVHDDSEWVSLQNNNIQDINRPEPLGFARSDPNMINKSNSTTINSTTLTSPSVLTSIMDNITSIVYENIPNDKNDTEKVSIKIDSVREMSSTTSSPSITVHEKQSYNYRRATHDEDLSSLPSSLTMPSYREVSPTSRMTNETPITKLLGPSYKQTEQFLKDLREVKLTYGSDDGVDNNSTSLDSATQSKNESCQIGESMMHYANLSPLSNEGDLNVQTIKNILIEQDITFASINLTSHDSQDDNHSNQRNTELSTSVAKSVCSKKDSEGELSLSELTDQAIDGRKIASSQNSKSSGSMLHNLKPIQEFLSPKKKTPAKVSMQSHNVDNWHASLNSNTKSSNKPTRGLYDIRNSTSPGSTNRRRLLTGKPLKAKINRNHDPLLVYVSEDSKLTESVVSTSLHPQDIESPGQHSANKTSHLGSSERSLRTSDIIQYTPDSHIEEIAKRVLHDNKQDTTKHKQDIISTAFSPHQKSILHLSTDESDPIRSNNAALHRKDYHSTDEPESTQSDNTEELINSNSTFFADSSDATTPINNYKVDQDKHSPIVYPKSLVEPIQRLLDDIQAPETFERHKIYRNDTDKTKAISTERVTPRTGTHEGKDLNKLWQDFESSFTNEHDAESPVLKKLELFSRILSEQKKKRSSKINSSISTDSFSSATSTPIENLAQRGSVSSESKKNQKATRYTVNQNKLSAACPYCQKREVGTNCPTPCTSDADIEKPLMLQTWTQTTPTVRKSILNKEKNHFDSKVNGEGRKKIESSHRYMRPSRNTWFPQEKENNQNTINTRNVDEKSCKLERQDTYIVHVPDKILAMKSTQQKKPTNDVTSLSEVKVKRGEVAYTAWFQTMRSDISDVVPLCEVPNLDDHQRHRVKFLCNNEKKSSENTPSLQDAFRVHKQAFIYRSKQRMQDVRDARLDEKHCQRDREKLRQRIPQKEKHRTTTRQHEFHRRREILMADIRPSMMRRKEEEHQAVLRRNRLKMKRYDFKIRQRFLQHQPKKRTGRYFIERH